MNAADLRGAKSKRAGVSAPGYNCASQAKNFVLTFLCTNHGRIEIHFYPMLIR
jgi:hypothetical protein